MLYANTMKAQRPEAGAAPRPSTLSDVARLAGVSTMTVSRVINGPAKVAPDTRAKVLAAMESLDYQPNLLARGLASGRSRSIGVLTVDTTLYGPRAALRGIELAARDRGYTVTITTLNNPDRTAVAEAANLLRSRSTDGVILVQPLISDDADDLPRDLPPMVAVHAGRPGDYPLISVDQRRGAQLATGHLLSLGHRTVWHIAGPDTWYESRERLLGWRQALVQAGAPEPQLVRGDWSAASGYRAAQDLLREPDLTAVFVANDQMALGFMHALHERGLRCPDHVSLVGFDDIPEAEYFCPGLTTVRQDFDEIGRRSVELLVDLIEKGRVAYRHLVLEPQLIIRDSTAPPAKR